MNISAAMQSIPLRLESLVDALPRLPPSAGKMMNNLASAAMAFNTYDIPSIISSVGSDAQYFDDPDGGGDIRALLDSRFEGEKAKGMKRLLALISQGRDVSEFYPQVVKNIVVESQGVKRLVYTYLAHYAERRPDEALLSINTFNKDLGKPSATIRAQALRAMACVRLPVVAPLVVMAAQQCSRDAVPGVRRGAAHAIAKVHTLERDLHHDALVEVVKVLIGDSSPEVVSAAAAAMASICPDQLSILTPHFRALCQMLPDMDAWGQIVMCNLLLRNALQRFGPPAGLTRAPDWHGCTAKGISEEKHFSRRELLSQQGAGAQHPKKSGGTDDVLVDVKSHSDDTTWEGKLAQPGFYSDDEDEEEETKKLSSRGSASERQVARSGKAVSLPYCGPASPSVSDPARSQVPGGRTSGSTKSQDVGLLLQMASPLLRSHNCAAVLAGAMVFWHLAPREELKEIARPLTFLLRAAPDFQFVVLTNIASMATSTPELFEPLFYRFFVSALDPLPVRELKLAVLALVASEASFPEILAEFQAYTRDPDLQFVALTARAIGSCAARLPAVASTCMEGLLHLALGPHSTFLVPGTKNDGSDMEGKTIPSRRTSKGSGAMIVTDAVHAIRVLVQRDPAAHEQAVARLVQGLDVIQVAEARAEIIWLLGEYCTTGSLIPRMAATVVCYLGHTFVQEEEATKLQIMSTCAKVLLKSRALPHSPDGIQGRLLTKYVLELARYDVNYDVRDRARLIRWLLVAHGDLDGPRLPSVESNDAVTSEMRVESCGDEISVGPGDEGTLIRDLSGALGGQADAREADASPVQEPGAAKESLGSSTGASEISTVGSAVQDPLERGGWRNLPTEAANLLKAIAEQMLLPPKPVPDLKPLVRDRSSYQLGSMSHLVNHRAPGYEPLPEFEEDLADPASNAAPAEGASQLPDHDGAGFLVGAQEARDESEEEELTESSYTGSSSAGEEYMEEVEGGTKGSAVPGIEPALRGAASRDGQGMQEESGQVQGGSTDPAPLIDFFSSQEQPVSASRELEEEAVEDSAVASVPSVVDLLSGSSLDDWLGPSTRDSPAVEADGKLSTDGSLWCSGREGSSSAAPGDDVPFATSAGEAVVSRDCQPVGEHLTERNLSWKELPLEKMEGRPRRQRLLDFANGDGLEVDYSMLRAPHSLSDCHMAVKLHLQNRSSRPIYGIQVRPPQGTSATSSVAADASVASLAMPVAAGNNLVPVVASEEVEELDPGQAAQITVHVDFRHQLKPVRFLVCTLTEVFAVKLFPEAGALLRPRQMTFDEFRASEKQLQGMHEATRRGHLAGRLRKGRDYLCSSDEAILGLASMVIQRVLDAADICQVAGYARSLIATTHDSDNKPSLNSNSAEWFVTFSGETLQGAEPCLLTVASEEAIDYQALVKQGNSWRIPVRLKINCADAVYGLSLLRQLEAILDAA